MAKRLTKLEIEEIINESNRLSSQEVEFLFYRIGINEEVLKSLPAPAGKGIRRVTKKATKKVPSGNHVRPKNYSFIGEQIFFDNLAKIQKKICKNGKPKPIYAVNSVPGVIVAALVGDLSKSTISIFLALIYKLGIDTFCANIIE